MQPNRRPKRQRKVSAVGTDDVLQELPANMIDEAPANVEEEKISSFRNFFTKEDSLNTIKKGTFGKITKMYRVKGSDERAYAVKTMDRKRGDEFEREKTATRKLKEQKYIMETVAMFWDVPSERFCVITPYFECNLEEALANRFRLPPGEWENKMTRQLIKGIAAIHAREIVHRDIRPDNIHLTEEGRAQISDFGSSAFCKKGQVLMAKRGVPPYRAPEMTHNKHFGGYSYEVDWWTAGIIIKGKGNSNEKSKRPFHI